MATLLDHAAHVDPATLRSPVCCTRALGVHTGGVALRPLRGGPAAVWTRPTPDRDEEFTRPSYVPSPGTTPVITPYRRDDQPLYTPGTPEFKPAELPEQQKEMPKGPSMPGTYD